MITWENYEEYMMMEADGELQPHEAEELHTFIKANPQLENEMALYQSARLTPDMTQVYEHKNDLLKTVPAARRIAFIPGWRTYGIAAGLAALIVLGYVGVKEMNTHAEITGGQVAQRNEATQSSPVQDVVKPEKDTTVHAAEVANTTPDANSPVPLQSSNNKMLNTPVHTPASNEAIAQHQKPVTPPALQRTIIDGIAPGSMQQLPMAQNTFKMAQPLLVQENTVAVNEIEKRSWLDKLPIGDDQKEKLNNVADKVSGGISQAASLKESIADKSLSIRIERRKLIFSF